MADKTLSNQEKMDGNDDVSLNADAVWTTCRGLLRSQVSEAVWLTSFRDLHMVTMATDRVVLVAPSSVIRDRVLNRYLPMVEAALADAGCRTNIIEIDVQPELANSSLIDEEPQVEEETPAAPDLRDRLGSPTSNATRPNGSTGDSYTDTIQPLYTFESFVTGTSNRFAHAAALAVAETPGRSYNPLFIHGAAGLGKTHLLQAIVHYIRSTYPNYTARYVSTETFMNEFVEAIRTSTTSTFKRRYRDIDVLLIDDIQFMEGKEGLQEEFFHTFNSLHGAGRQVILSSDRPPRNIATLEDRLRSRFEWGLITDIQPPDVETRLAILRKKTEVARSEVPDEALEFIAELITNNIRELEGALIRVSAYASLTDEPISVDLAERVLGDIVHNNESRPITPDVILNATSDMFGYDVEELQGKRRHRSLVQARQISMYVVRELTDLSYPAIAREFGGRDHTTVMHAVEKVGNQMAERRQVYDQVSALISDIKSN
ncbi:MAG: chromosomal replication initiator protein DnaA [Acidimicrobiales bacterium]|jgi:chromosomal replication initiator protein|nr:chromosomal replication initiator protein DnaA [Acidimicrobiales bacterium]MDP6900813.1 chromosomal replication initiator protein DnaA [Acidimicrobiales bacterium]